MVVKLYLICEARGIWSFREQPNATPVRARVPRGSSLLPVQGLGLELFVPSAGDKLQRHAWNANAVMREARQGGRFKLVGAGNAKLAVG